MKTTTIEQLAQNAKSLVDAAQNERVVVTRDGEPVAVLVGIHHKDAEDLQLESSREFWQMIEQRRQESAIPLNDLEPDLDRG